MRFKGAQWSSKGFRKAQGAKGGSGGLKAVQESSKEHKGAQVDSRKF